MYTHTHRSQQGGLEQDEVAQFSEEQVLAHLRRAVAGVSPSLGASRLVAQVGCVRFVA